MVSAQSEPTLDVWISTVNPKAHCSDSETFGVVPKGLRAFDSYDAEFFLSLLPGPRDSNGLPRSVRFWKTSIEETNRSATFSVGVIYGPSGSGKSSLVKAGLLPNLSQNVITNYLEATTQKEKTHGPRRNRRK